LIAAVLRKNCRANIACSIFVYWIVPLLPLLWTGAVLAAERAKLDPTQIPLLTWALVLASAIVGYLASSAEMLFGWVVEKGWREFGRLVQSFFCSMAAGGIAYLLGVYSDLTPIMSLIAVVPASYAGETYMRKLADKQNPSYPTNNRDKTP
jgi:hypothetical protein